jgi:hypothetical protein
MTIFIQAVNCPSYTNLPLGQLLHLLKSFNSQSPLLQSIFFISFFKQPAISTLPKDVLLHHFRRVPSHHKIPFLTQMIQVLSFKKPSFEELLSFTKEFRSHPRNEVLTLLFYASLFNHPSIKCISNLSDLKSIFPEEASDEAIPILNEVAKHSLGATASLKTIKFLMKNFSALYKYFPCSDSLAEGFYTTLFKMPNMSKAPLKDLEFFLRKCPPNLYTLACSFAFKHPSLKDLPKESLLTAFEGFLLEGKVAPVSRNINQRFIKSVLSNPLVKEMPPSEILEKLITPAKGYQLIDIIMFALSSPHVGAFSLDEIYSLNRLFLDEIKSLEGEKPPSRMPFYLTVCNHLEEKHLLSKREAKAETHKLVHSYPN